MLKMKPSWRSRIRLPGHEGHTFKPFLHVKLIAHTVGYMVEHF